MCIAENPSWCSRALQEPVKACSLIPQQITREWFGFGDLKGHAVPMFAFRNLLKSFFTTGQYFEYCDRYKNI